MKALLKTIHLEIHERLKTFGNTIQRNIHLTEVKNKISVIIGMRRVGKTSLMYNKIRQLMTEGVPLTCILYIDFEDDRLLPLNQHKLAEILDGFYSLYPENHQKLCYLFLDEIQIIEGWALVIRRIQNTKQVRIFLSGSSAKLLSKEIATELRGRSIATEVFPFSFFEYLTFNKVNIPAAPFTKPDQDYLIQLLNSYLQEGGFPGVVGEATINQMLILQEYIDVVLFRDIVERHHITHVSIIKYMIHYMLKNNATRFSINKFFNDLKSQGFQISRSTLYDYLSYIEDAYLMFTVSLYSESIRKTQNNLRKIYAIDNGLVNANKIRLLKNEGRALENLFFLDLKRRGHEVSYYLTKQGYEVDFISQDLYGKVYLYQVALAVDDPETLAREVRALEAAEKELGIKGTLITLQNYLEWSLSDN